MEAMREAPDLGIPEVKPAIESIRGVWERKVSPKTRHALVQARLAVVLTNLFGDRGDVGTEWRFYLLPDNEQPSSLVPDVAYVSHERMPPSFGELRERPTIAPDIAIEVLSPGDRTRTLETKIALFLAHGSRSVFVVDPIKRTIVIHERGETVSFREGEIAASLEYPDLRIELSKLFERL
jgi:Uma2 family endonuclease